jgi:hypothetical protein
MLKQTVRSILTIAILLYQIACQAQESSGNIPGDSLFDIHFRVQIGAFQGTNPCKDKFTLTQYETYEGVTRQTVGRFMSIEGATSARDTLRGMGYKDAFVVAYRNGIRIPLKEARRPPREVSHVIRDTVIVEVNGECETLSLQDSITELSSEAKRAKIVMLKENLSKKAWIKVLVGETVLVSAVVLSIVTGAWVPIMMGAAAVEIYLLVEGNYRLNTRKLKRMRREGDFPSQTSLLSYP